MKLFLATCVVGFVASTCWRASNSQSAAPSEPRRAANAVLNAIATPADLGDRAYAHVAALCKIGERYTGSPGWQQSLDYMVRKLEQHGLKPVRDRWIDPIENITFTNVVVTIPGKRKDKIVIGCHHDTKRTNGHDDKEHNFKFVGANDAGSGVGLLLELAKELQQRDNEATFELVFFDGEESLDWSWNEAARALFGSRRYVGSYSKRRLQTSSEPPIRAFVLLDMIGSKDLAIDRELNSDPTLLNIVYRAAQATGHSAFFHQHEQHVADDHKPFIAANIPSVDLIDMSTYLETHWHKPSDTIDKISAASLQIVGEVVMTALPEIERVFLPERRKD